MLIDFHTHSTASDGALSPRELIDRALARGVDQFAITDHDTMAGYIEGSEYYTQLDAQMMLVSGVEFSCRWSGVTVHIVGLDMDWQHPAMAQGLAQLAQARQDRGQKIAARLERLGLKQCTGILLCIWLVTVSWVALTLRPGWPSRAMWKTLVRHSIVIWVRVKRAM